MIQGFFYIMKSHFFILLCLLAIHGECKWKNNGDKNAGKWHRYESANEISTNKPHFNNGGDPPDHTKLIPMARYVIRNADWASIATISSLPAVQGFPFNNVKSIVEGNSTNSTGVPYFYMSPLDFTARDLSKNNRATVLISLEQTDFCRNQNMDPEDPRCTRLILTGKMKKVKEDTAEFIWAKAALFERHPAMANFPADHDWFIAKLKIAQIAMVDWYGGAKYIAVKDYLAYNNATEKYPAQIKYDHTKSVLLNP